jgi:hypothetical protein
MTKKLCDGKINSIWKDAGDRREWNRGFELFPTDRPKGIKRIRLECPLCGRRVMSSVEMNHDGDYIIHSLPPHKARAWWKKHTKRKEKSRKIR